MTSTIFDGLTILAESVDAAGWRARLRVEPTSRAFDGHFEGQPILPAIAHLLILGYALRAGGSAGSTLRELSGVRFRRPVRPGDVLDVAVAPADAEGRHRFDVHVAGELAVTGTARGA